MDTTFNETEAAQPQGRDSLHGEWNGRAEKGTEFAAEATLSSGGRAIIFYLAI